MGDQPPQQHSIQQQDEEERNEDTSPFNRAEWARRVLTMRLVGPQWANPVARDPPQPQSSGTESTASSTSRLFDALDMPPLRMRAS